MNSSTNNLSVTHFGPTLAEPPTLSVLMITYRHETYIREALESVFAQKTDFAIEVVIGEDCSPDGTRDIIDLVCAQAPISVSVITSAQNVGMQKNFRRTLAACRGRYVALIEGDDLWLEPTKLTRQIQQLRNAPAATMSFHRAVVRYQPHVLVRVELGNEGSSAPENIPHLVGIEEVTSYQLVIPTASVVVHREIFNIWPDWADELPWADTLIFLIAADRGEIVYLEDAMSVYRITNNGASAGLHYNKVYKGFMLMLWRYLPLAREQNRKAIRAAHYRFFDNFADQLAANGATRDLGDLLRQQLRREICRLRPRAKTFKWWLSVEFPRTFQVTAMFKRFPNR